ncbi:hypothetical protein [Tenacibaculum sp. 47A_GOM-205m]|uniref:hypothetical protein n=1 Tax=Tenacibaculum sp. 47A_GOM-205m TaxID=1380384 RepID=UPI000491289A|nr:hypothetical protein [Tenacibaculum sp. 47A_GOM-205m]
MQKTLKTQKTKNIATYIIAFICLTSLFSFEFVNDYSEGFFIAKNQYQVAIDSVNKTLDPIKDYSKNTDLFNNYVLAKNHKDLAKKEYFKIKKEEELFGFKNKKIFLAELGPMICFFVYILFMMFSSLKSKKVNRGLVLLHVTVLLGPLFYFYWIFQPFQDLSSFSYYLATILTAICALAIVYILTKQKKDTIEKLNSDFMEVAKFTFKNTKPEKREEMLDMIKKIAQNK